MYGKIAQQSQFDRNIELNDLELTRGRKRQ
jgi:hypothetical protein